MKSIVRFLLFIFIAGIAVKLNGQFSFNVIHSFHETNHKVVFASFNSTGNYVITAGADSNIIIWNADRRTIFRTISGLKGRPNDAVISPDNNLVYSGGRDNLVSVWDIKPMIPTLVKTFSGFNGPVESLDISPDGKLLATGSTGGSLKIWDVQTTTSPLFDLKTQDKKTSINSVDFSPDGTILATGSADGNITIWNVSDGTLYISQSAQKSGIHQVVFSRDGKHLASCGYSNEIFVCDIPGLSNKIILKGHKNWVQSVDFTPDGKYIISGGRDGLIVLWDLASGKILHQSEKQPGTVTFVKFNPSRPDFISSNYQSEEIEMWALRGFDESQWNNSEGIIAVNKSIGNIHSGQLQKAVTEPSVSLNEQAVNVPAANSMITLFSPVPSQGKITHDKNSIVIVGRVADPQGINTFLINRNVIKLSEGGVFQYDLNLSKGENLIDLVAINSKGIMNEQKLIVDCTAESGIVAGEEFPEIAKSNYYALIIGNGEYQSDEITDLDFPVRDAQSLYDVLLSNYNFEKENIKFLKNPTYKEIFYTLEDYGNKLTQNDNLLIFYAGHGYWDEKGGIGYWLPSDAAKNSRVNWFSNSLLRDFISGIQTKHTLLIADACFSGAIFKSRAAFTETPKGIEKLYEVPSRKAMTSGTLKEEVPDESQFIKYLVKNLNENKDKYLPSEILFSSFKAAVMNNSPTVPQYGVIQNVGDEGGGDFVFIHK